MLRRVEIGRWWAGVMASKRDDPDKDYLVHDTFREWPLKLPEYFDGRMPVYIRNKGIGAALAVFKFDDGSWGWEVHAVHIPGKLEGVAETREQAEAVAVAMLVLYQV